MCIWIKGSQTFNCLKSTWGSRYMAVMYKTMEGIAQQLQWENFSQSDFPLKTTPHTPPAWEIFKEKWSRVHCIAIRSVEKFIFFSVPLQSLCEDRSSCCSQLFTITTVLGKRLFFSVPLNHCVRKEARLVSAPHQSLAARRKMSISAQRPVCSMFHINYCVRKDAILLIIYHRVRKDSGHSARCS